MSDVALVKRNYCKCCGNPLKPEQVAEVEPDLVPMHQCLHFSPPGDRPGCNAPWCPFDPDLHRVTWIPGEDICQRQDKRRIPWIRKQRQIVKSIKKHPKSLDAGRALQLADIMARVPEKRVLTEEEKQVLRDRMAKLRESQKDGVSLSVAT